MKNEYGLDVDYFKRYFELMVRDVSMYRPDEMARSLSRMALVADSDVLKEDEFTKDLDK